MVKFVVLVALFWSCVVTAQDNLPETDVNLVKFYLWTNENPTEKEIIEFQNRDSARASSFNPTRLTKVLIHGYTDNGTSYWIQEMRDEFFKLGSFNIISVDYQPLGIGPHYPLAAENAKPVGLHAAEFIRFMIDEMDGKIEDFHPIGFSLGGQVVGNLGHGLAGELPRISALDPAGFMFHTVSDDDRLSKKSAKFVDVIHTAGLWKGMDEPSGHVDFYPNRGVASMPGCEGESVSINCSHHRAPAFYKESINSDTGFLATLCDSWTKYENGTCDEGSPVAWMGYHLLQTETHGNYFLRTESAPPYAIYVEPPTTAVPSQGSAVTVSCLTMSLLFLSVIALSM